MSKEQRKAPAGERRILNYMLEGKDKEAYSVVTSFTEYATEDGWKVIQPFAFAQTSAALRSLGHSWAEIRKSYTKRKLTTTLTKRRGATIRKHWFNDNTLKMFCYHMYQRHGLEWPIVRLHGRGARGPRSTATKIPSAETPKYTKVTVAYLKRFIKKLISKGATKDKIVDKLNKHKIDFKHASSIRTTWSKHKLDQFCRRHNIKYKLGRPRNGVRRTRKAGPQQRAKTPPGNGVSKRIDPKLVMATVTKEELASIINQLSSFSTLTVITVKAD